MVDVPFSLLDSGIADRLEATPHLGGPPEQIEESQGGFIARLHDRPIGLSLKSMFTERKTSPKAKLYDSFDLWMIPHRFSIQRLSGFATIAKAGCEVQYLSEGETLSIISLIPATEYVETLKAGVDLKSSGKAGFRFRADLSDTGLLEQIGDALTKLLPVSASAGLSASTQLSANAKINLSMSVLTQHIAAIGIGSTHCFFQLSAHEEPLFDRDIETWAIVALPKRTEEVKYRLRCFFETRRLFVPRTWQTGWTEITVSKGSSA